MASRRKKLNKKIKIAIFHCGFIYSGGGERIVLEEARGLTKRGYDVSVHAPTVDYKKCFPEMLKELKVKMLLPSYFDKLPLRNALRMLASSLLAPLLAINFKDVDIFIGANQPGIWIAYCISKVLNKPYIAYLNQPNRIVYPRPIDVKYGWYTTNKDYHLLYTLLNFVKPILGYLDRYSIRGARRVLVNGGYIGDIIQNIYSIRTIDAPAGSYAHKLSKRRITSKPYILITNRHDPQKRFDFVIRAMDIIVKTNKDIKLVIPGPYTEHTKHLKKLAKNLNIEENVQFIGIVTEKRLQTLYSHATVYCYPSPQEDFGLGPLEAGGWGVPTVAWNHAGPTVTVEDGVSGFLAEPFQISDYAKKILKLVGNKSLRDKMGKAAYLRTKNEFSWEKHTDILEETIKKVI